MPVPSSIADLSTSAGSNSPAGSETPSSIDDYLRSHASFIAQMRAVIGGAVDANIPNAIVKTTSATDTTAGRVLKVGDFGAGAAAGTALWGNANLVKTTSATDTTAGSMLKVGDFGLPIVADYLALPKLPISDSTTDLNTITEAGWFGKLLGGAEGSRPPNYPIGQAAGANYVYLFVMRYSANQTQVAYSYASSTSTSPQVWMRFGVGGVWTAWVSLYTSASTRMAYGVAPSAWAAGYSTLDLGTFGISSNQSGALTFLGNNIYFDGTNYKHKIDGVGHVMTFGALGIPLVFSAAAAGTAGNNASLVPMFAIDANGLVAVSSPTGGLGYGAGAGGAVTQITNKSTGVTLNRPCGQITMSGASLAASTAVSFTLANSLITATDNIDANIQSGAATGGSYNLTVDAVAAGSCRVSLRNMTAGALAEALVLNISVKKSVNA